MARQSGTTDGFGASAPNPVMSITLYLKHRPPRRPGSAADLAALSQRVDRGELAAERNKALARPMALIRRFADKHGMRIRRLDALRARVILSARRTDLERAFKTRLKQVTVGDSACHCPQDTPRIPAPLRTIVEAVVGLDQRPRLGRLRARAGPVAAGGLLPSDIARLYGIAAATGGKGQCIAIVEPKGGYDPADVRLACGAMHVPVPQLVDVAVGKGRNAFGVDPVADKEVSLDIQVAAGVAPAARIAIYFTESDEQGFVNGIAQAVHDRKNKPSVVVVTWGEPEVFWPPAARKALDAVLADAVRLGVTVVAAAGDELATEQMNDGKVHVDYPASSPYVLGCGGTTITLDANGGAIADEVVWKDEPNAKGTGGGISTLFGVPAFQKKAKVPPSASGGRRGRGVPDVAAAASETNGYRIFIGGGATVASGTSAVAPLWGAIVALVNAQRRRSVGYINPFLYQHPELLRVITQGDNISPIENIGYSATDGWSACTGLGVPKGADLIRALTAIA